jgi:tetratricopeptide (TPR) repeat protein
MSDKNVKKMTLDELRAELNDSDIHTRKIEICTQILDLIPEEAKDDKSKAFHNRSDIYMSLGEYQKAINDYDQIIALNPKDDNALSNRGAAYAGLGEHQKAINDCDQAITLNPKNAMAFGNRGASYSYLDEYQKAINDYDQAIALNPKDASFFVSRGAVYASLNEYQKAINDYDQAIALDPKNAEVFVDRGVAYYRLGEHQKAIEDYDQAITLNQKYARAFYNRGIIYRNLGKEEKAIKDFKKAQDLDPSIIAKEQIELIEKELSEKIKKTQASNKEVQNFQEILAVLKEEHKKEEDRWFEWSKWAVVATLVVISIAIAIGFFKSSDTYIIYVFSSIVTFAVIRQYTNAKALRIEASNRVAMSKMFEQVKHENDDAYRQEFLPKLADAIAYSTIKEKNNTDGLVEKIINGLEKLRK